MRTLWHDMNFVTYCFSMCKKFGTDFENQHISSFTEIFQKNINKQINKQIKFKLS